MSDRRIGPSFGIDVDTDDRGVSEVVAFVLVFAIILGSVGLLYSTAFGAMTDYQQNEQETNAVRAMDTITDNFNDVLRSNGVNERSGELALRGGRISTADGGTSVNVTIEGENGGKPLGTGGDDQFAGYGDGATADLGEFAYVSDDDETIAYEGGGLVRGDGSGSVVVRNPQLRCDPDGKTAIVSLVTVTAADRSIRADGQLDFTMAVENRSSAVYTDVDDVTVSVDDETAYEAAWNDVLSGAWDDGNLTGTCEPDDGTELERVVVTIVEVGINDD